MKILFLGHTFNEPGAAVRLSKALKNKNIIIDLIAKISSLSNVKRYKPNYLFSNKIYSKIRKYFILFFIWKKYTGKIHTPWSINFWAPRPFRWADLKDFDIIHLHWIANSFISLKTLSKIKKPLVWTLHDVWGITGGCHCNLGCEKWENACGFCPQLGSLKENDISRKFWKKKRDAITKIENLTVISPSKWLFDKVKQSQFFVNANIVNIPNCIDTSVFIPINKKKVRKELGLPQNKKILLFGAANYKKATYKGFDLLLQALELLAKEGNNSYHLLIFGNNDVDHDLTTLSINYTSLGKINSEIGLVKAYNAADVFVGPSRQDNFPGTFLEAAACGIPAVGFRIGGIPEIVDHKQTGYIAKPFNVEDLVAGIKYCFENNSDGILNKNARNKVLKNYTFDIIAQKHIMLYKELIEKNN